MKKNILLILLVYSNIINSQSNDSLIKKCLKEVLVVQSLLAENRNEDLVIFLAKNNWIPIPNKESMFGKSFDSIPNSEFNNIFQRIRILPEQTEGLSNKNVILDFHKNRDNLEDMCFTKVDCNKLLSYFKNSYELGLIYNYFQEFSNIKQQDVLITKIDRYNFSVENIKSPQMKKVIYKCSNFMSGSTYGIDEKYTFFSGPGKNNGTIIQYVDDFSCPMAKDDFMPTIVFHTFMLNSDTIKLKKENFDIDFFMGLENFNDRIWGDN